MDAPEYLKQTKKCPVQRLGIKCIPEGVLAPGITYYGTSTKVISELIWIKSFMDSQMYSFLKRN